VIDAERGSDVLGIRVVGPGREANEVDEEHGDHLALLNGRSEPDPESGPTVRAELRSVGVLLAAGGATHGRSLDALPAAMDAPQRSGRKLLRTWRVVLGDGPGQPKAM
jgi:hypothetical protein